MRNPLLDEEFLHQLDLYPHHHVWAKIISLDFNEYPIEEISGRVSSGSINIDGDSSVRRTCSLSLLTEDVNVNDFDWGLKTKFKLYIGLENHIIEQYKKEKKDSLQNNLVEAKKEMRQAEESQNSEEYQKWNSIVSYLTNSLQDFEEIYDYPDIVWFNQGVFLISSFSVSVGINSTVISIQGKDKMALLNGELGGVIPASWDFGKIDQVATDEDGNTVYDTNGYAITETLDIPIKDIILQAVHEFAQEKWQNIIVNDLDDYGIEMLEYKGDTPLYYIISESASSDSSCEVVNMTLNGDMPCEVMIAEWLNERVVEYPAWVEGLTLSQLDNAEVIFDKIKQHPLGHLIEEVPVYSYERFVDTVKDSITSSDYFRQVNLDEDSYQQGRYWIIEDKIFIIDESRDFDEDKTYFEKISNSVDTYNYYRAKIRLGSNGDYTDDIYTVAKISKEEGTQVCGYRVCDIVYPYDLIAAPGDSVTSILDKLVQMLGNFEYFYDEEGHFIFQKKRTYLDVSYNNLISEHSIGEETWANNGEFSSKYSYTFDNNILVSSIQNSPQISELKNDFSIWGQRETGSLTLPIHMRYSIDKKPFYYKVIGHTHLRDEFGNAVKDEDGNYIYTDEGKLFITNQAAKDLYTRYGQEVKVYSTPVLEKIERIINKTGYPKGLSKDWYKLEDWLFLYGAGNALAQDQRLSGGTLTEDLVQQYYPPRNVFMSSGRQNSILSGEWYQTMRTLREIFWDSDILAEQGLEPEEKGRHWPTYLNNKTSRISDDYATNIVDIINIPYEGKYVIGSVEHGGMPRAGSDGILRVQGCYHTWAELLDRINGDPYADIYIYAPDLLNNVETNTIVSSDIRENIQNLYDNINTVDWREIIFQMAQDYRQHYREDDFLLKIKENNQIPSSEQDSYYPTGITGYEQYYVDFEMNSAQGVVAYWRELYNPDMVNARGLSHSGRYDSHGQFLYDEDIPEWQEGTVYNKNDKVAVIVEDKGKQNRIIYRCTRNGTTEKPSDTKTLWVESAGDFSYNSDGWNVNILNDPSLLNFWFDFLDTTGEMNKYSVHNIGLRSKAVNDDKIKAIYFREVPNVVFETNQDRQKRLKEHNNEIEWAKPGYCYLQIPDGIMNFFSISTRGKNCFDQLEDDLYRHAYAINSITLTSIPIYYLQPNTLIYVNDPVTGVIGEYMLKKYSIQFGANPQMSISAVETTKRLY